ncbi:MAG: transcriptional regulator [Verrucomicrobia bacterium]|nr:MAG: transcriptional regulator [Verrucomicrobiota bacterium]
MARSGLGKGLGALIGTSTPVPRAETAESGERVHQISLISIVPSALQPRKDFGRDALQELIDSIRQHGIIQPLIVRPASTTSVAAATGQAGARFELIAGERRWRAAQEIGLGQVPVIIRSASDMEVLELSLIENLQRADLNPIEEAQGYARLASEFGMRQEDIALKVGRSRAAVANAMRLLDLHPQVQIWLAQDLLSVGHAKVLLALKMPEEQLLAAETVLRRNATVRSTERLVARQLGIGRSRRKSRRVGTEQVVTSAAIEDLQNRLQEELATHVTIHHGEKRGRIEIEYYGNDDLQRILTALGLTPNES